MSNIRPEGRFANALAKAMREQNLTIDELRLKAGVSYEHIRKLVKGVTFPSKWALKELCNILGLNYEDMNELVIADRIENKWGGIPHTLAGNHPELSLLADSWDKLTPMQKDMLKLTIKNFANENQRHGLVPAAKAS